MMATRRSHLADVATITKGVSYRSVDLRPGGATMLSLKCFDRDGSFSWAGLKDYDGPYKPDQSLDPGDVVVAQTDLTQGALVVGRALLVPEELGDGTVVGSLDVAIVRTKTDEVLQAYLGYALQSEDFREHCRRRASGTTVLHLPSGAMDSYDLEFPISLDRQRWVVEVMRAIDGKGAANIRLAAQAIRVAVASYPQMARTRRRLSDLFSLQRGVSYSGRMLAEEGVPMLNLANFGIDGQFITDGLKYINEMPPANRQASVGDLLVANTDLTQERRIVGRAMLYPPVAGAAHLTYSHHVYRAVPIGERAGVASVAYLAMRQSPYLDWVRSCATGTTVAGISARDILSFEVDWPDDDAFDSVRRLVDDTSALIWSLDEENRRLRLLRNALLPGLLSGETVAKS